MVAQSDKAPAPKFCYSVQHNSLDNKTEQRCETLQTFATVHKGEQRASLAWRFQGHREVEAAVIEVEAEVGSEAHRGVAGVRAEVSRLQNALSQNGS